MELKDIVIKDELIISFYRDNPTLNIITMNHILIDILKKLSVNLSETINNTVREQLRQLHGVGRWHCAYWQHTGSGRVRPPRPAEVSDPTRATPPGRPHALV